MLKALGVVVGVLVVGLVALFGYAATKPDAFSVQRSANINAPAERIFPLIASMRSFNTWNPFIAPDPDIKIQYVGAESGSGSAQTWVGNSQVGEGRLTVTDASTPSRVAMRLEMLKPLTATNAVEFLLKPNGSSTTVTWTMTGEQPLVGKVISVFMNMDHMVGSQFEKGLASLKAASERS